MNCPSPSRPPRFLIPVLLLLLLAPLACGQGAGRTGPVAPGPTEIPPPPLASRPDGLAREFLDLVRSRHFDQAYGFLGSRVRSQVSQEQFRTTLEEALRTASTRTAYQNRWIQSERIRRGRAYITVTDRQYPETLPWVWVFEREGGAWKLQELHLPPIDTDAGATPSAES